MSHRSLRSHAGLGIVTVSGLTQRSRWTGSLVGKDRVLFPRKSCSLGVCP